MSTGHAAPRITVYVPCHDSSAALRLDITEENPHLSCLHCDSVSGAKILGFATEGLAGTPDPGVQSRPAGVPAVAPVQPDGPSIFTALEEQLGLRLVSGRGPVEMLVVERLEQPSPD